MSVSRSDSSSSSAKTAYNVEAMMIQLTSTKAETPYNSCKCCAGPFPK